jgi:hypothetical protein
MALVSWEAFDDQSGSRILPVGEYEFRAGFSSRDICATAVVSIPQGPTDEPT